MTTWRRYSRWLFITVLLAICLAPPLAVIHYWIAPSYSLAVYLDKNFPPPRPPVSASNDSSGWEIGLVLAGVVLVGGIWFTHWASAGQCWLWLLGLIIAIMGLVVVVQLVKFAWYVF